MSCNKSQKNFLKCQSCESELCEDCYLQQIEKSDNIICVNCSQENFEEIKENEKDNEDQNAQIKKNIDDTILNNNLNLESRNTIKNYIENFKNEFTEVLDQKFKDFAIKPQKKFIQKFQKNILN